MSLSTNTKKIHLALGALIDGSYLWAGADKTISSEMQGKDNGDTIYYKRTKLLDAEVKDAKKESNTSSDMHGTLSFNGITQVDTKVGIWDARVGYAVNALDKEITNYGEALALVKVGQKLGKKAVEKAASSDIPRIGNIWLGSNWQAFQTASAFMKSFIDEKLYGWTHWEAWGKLTAQGQNAVPCGLADKRFGHELIGKWNLIDELRSCKFLNKIKLQTLDSTAKVKSALPNAVSGVHTITITNGATTDIADGETVFFTIPGVYETDTNGEQTHLHVFSFTNDTGSSIAASADFTVQVEEADGQLMIGFNSTNIAQNRPVSNAFSGGTAGHCYAPMLFRAEKAQCFGSMNKITCETAKYEKQSTDGFTIHVNADYDITQLIEKKRFDLVFASKLVEPRAAALVYIDLDA